MLETGYVMPELGFEVLPDDSLKNRGISSV
jgi:hypothetical protein